MELSIGEGQDGAPLRRGRWDGTELSVRYVEGDPALTGLSPSGERLMTVRDTGGRFPTGAGRAASSTRRP
ncbi:hypothetical protein ACWDE9_04125 [Streptomyces olivaceoviridis]